MSAKRPESTAAEPTSPIDDLRTIERELRRFLARARTLSTHTAAAVHPQLDPALYSMLMDVVAGAPIRSVDLAQVRGVSKSVISRQVAALESVGLIAREPDPTDARASVIVLTEQGREAARTIEAARRQHLKRLFEALTPQELAELARSLSRLNDIFE